MNTTCFRLLLAASGLSSALNLAALAQAAAPAQQTGPLAWHRETGAVALHSGGQTVWRFDFSTNATKPLFHPVALPGGPALTWDRPEDHPWHRALWFSWKFINGVNYWEEDANTGLAAGRTEWEPPALTLNPDFSARLALALRYHPPGAPTVLTERRVIETSRPAADGSWQMDWDLRFTAGAKDVLLDRTPLPNEPEGKAWGGYAGLSVRFSRDLQDAQATTASEPVAFVENRFRGKSAGLDYSGLLGGQPMGIAILDRPDNLNSPSPWYVIHEPHMKYFSPAVLCYGPHRLAAGQTLHLRYRVIVHPGRWDAKRLATEAAKP